MTVGVVIPTYLGALHLKRCLPPILASSLRPRVLVIDSSSPDGTVEVAKGFNVEVESIRKESFNHGLTRERGRLRLKTNIVVMLTQDAYAVDSFSLEKLVAPLRRGDAEITYARQIPHEGASFFEAFLREFNYPENGEIRSLGDVDYLGAATFFSSNSCAAYLSSALDKVGGFPKVEFGEDTHVAAKLLHQGGRIAYVAESQFFHSHCYSLKEEFQRHLLIGASRKKIRDLIGRDSKRGKEYVKRLFLKLLKEKPWLIPYGCLHIGAKWLGYRVGSLY